MSYVEKKKNILLLHILCNILHGRTLSLDKTRGESGLEALTHRANRILNSKRGTINAPCRVQCHPCALNMSSHCVCKALPSVSITPGGYDTTWEEGDYYGCSAYRAK